MNEVIEKVTQRILERSLESRKIYLDRIAKAKGVGATVTS